MIGLKLSLPPKPQNPIDYIILVITWKISCGKQVFKQSSYIMKSSNIYTQHVSHGALEAYPIPVFLI